jgi:tetratricopeptide (TPR) repeat protein
MAEIDLSEKFPDMRPIKSPPGLSTVNGLGCMVYGSRDHDADTNTHVKTHGLCVFFIPVLNLGAYRVADCPSGGWYFIGRVPLSAAAKLWNWFFLVSILAVGGSIAWYCYTHSADYLAGQKLAEADRLTEAGQIVSAAELYREVVHGKTKHSRTAVDKIKSLLDKPVQEAAPADAARVFAVAVDLRRLNGVPDNLFERAMKLADRHAQPDPRGALALVDAVATLAPDEAALTKKRRTLLERAVAKEPGDVELLSQLALLHEADRQTAKCEALLAPHVKRLGASEGARILGQIYAHQGNRRVVPVALDLGMVLLRRAQGMADAAARRRELEKAEKTFLAVQGQAGQDDLYRLNLGQVYYWLGKHAEGRKLFDELLEARQREPGVLVLVGRLLREVGAVSEARPLVEEAYRTEQKAAGRYGAAVQRAMMALELDDKITWLRRADPADPHVKVELSAALGDKALREGREVEAAQHLREAIASYSRLPESAPVFNNWALVYQNLFQLTGEGEALAKKAELLQKAVALQPRNSILLSNTAQSLEEVALRDIIGPAIDLQLLKMEARLDLIQYLFSDQAGQEQYLERLRRHAGLAKARSHYERLLLLAPKNPVSYGPLAALEYYTNDLDGLRELWQRLEKVELDVSDLAEQTRAYYAGKKDDYYRQTVNASIKNAQAILKKARTNARGITQAVAATTLGGYRIHLAALGGAVDANEIVGLAEEAHAAARSQATQSFLVKALLFRAGGTLTKEEPSYAKLAARTQRNLGSSFLIPIALAQGNKLRQAVLANADVQRSLTLLKDARTRFPNDADEWAWAMLRAVDPDRAAQVAHVIKDSKINPIKLAIDLKVAPFNAAEAFRASWAEEIAGNQAKAAAILKQCAAQGVPMPFEVK